MDDKKEPQNLPDNVPRWVRDDPEVLADWLATDWDADAKLFEQMDGKENQAVFIGGSGRPKPER